MHHEYLADVGQIARILLLIVFDQLHAVVSAENVEHTYAQYRCNFKQIGARDIYNLGNSIKHSFEHFGEISTSAIS